MRGDRFLIALATLSGVAGCGGLTEAETGEASSDLRDAARRVVDVASPPDIGTTDHSTADREPDRFGPDAACPSSDTPLMLASEQREPYTIVVSATNVYWTNISSATVVTVPSCGGSPVTLISEGSNGALAVDQTNLYWAKGTPESESIVLETPLSGGSTTALASSGSVLSLAVDATRVYWGDNGVLLAVPLGGGTTVTFPIDNLVAAEVATDSYSIYVPTQNRGAYLLLALPLDGGAPVTLTSGSGQPTGIALCGDSVCWGGFAGFAGAGGAIMTIPKAGGTPTTLVSGSTAPAGVAADSTTVYWTDSMGGTVMKISTSGGTPVTLASGQDGPTGIAVDATNVYWTNQFAGTVMKVAK
jgi:hypothetical protein